MFINMLNFFAIINIILSVVALKVVVIICLEILIKWLSTKNFKFLKLFGSFKSDFEYWFGQNEPLKNYYHTV